MHTQHPLFHPACVVEFFSHHFKNLSGTFEVMGVIINPEATALTHIFFPEFLCQRLCHANQTDFGCSIVGLTDIAVQSYNRRGIDNYTISLIDHDVNHCLGAIRNSFKIDVDDFIPRFLCHF